MLSAAHVLTRFGLPGQGSSCSSGDRDFTTGPLHIIGARFCTGCPFDDRLQQLPELKLFQGKVEPSRRDAVVPVTRK